MTAAPLPGVADVAPKPSGSDYCPQCDHDDHECAGCGRPTTHEQAKCCPGCAVLGCGDDGN